MKSIVLVAIAFLCSLFSFGQEVGDDAFAMGDHVNIAISGLLGREGTDDVGAGFHQRAPGTRCGFVADPEMTGWLDGPGGFNGDFFMPGSPENGWGLKLDDVIYSNGHDYEFDPYEDIVVDVANPISWSLDGDCITVEWQGITSTGVTANIKYHLTLNELFYTTEVTLINNSGEDLIDAYYFRNVDPDNNQPISFTYVTENTIVSQPEGDCEKALVSATQTTPHDSYVGFGGLGSNWRVSHGGFSNRDAEDIWNGTGGLTGTVGAVATADQAISIAYKSDILDGDTLNFTFAVVLSDDAVEAAFSSLYYIDYTSIGGDGGGLINQCNPETDTTVSCAGRDVTLTVDGPNADDYTWEWSSDPFDAELITDEVTVDVSPDVTTTYTVVGTPISDCFTTTIEKTIVVEFSEGPQIEWDNPGPQCEEFDITTLTYTDLNGTIDPNIVFLTEFPDSSRQTEPAFTGPLMGPDDEVWLMIGDTIAGCYDAVQILLEWGGLGAAGDDSTIALCGTVGTIVDLYDLLSEDANPLGTFEEETFSGQFNAGTGELNVGGLAGTYEFTYTVTGLDPCPDDQASFFVEVLPQPVANLDFEVDGDPIISTCNINEIDFVNLSTIPGGGTITSYAWDFGGVGTSTLENPSFTFTGLIGTFTITLTVTTADGCTDTFSKDVIVYEEPILDIIFNSPNCAGFSDGSITVFVAGGSGTFEIEIFDDLGTQLNAVGSNTANTLTAGTYTINVEDGSGCSADATIILTDPLPPIPFLTVVPPLCFGGDGYIVVDSVQGVNVNSDVAYFWAPVTDVPNGIGADSVNVPAGTYTLTVNVLGADGTVCSYSIDTVMTEPAQLVSAESGSRPAYCRVFDYQNGGGTVFYAASGGTGTISYEWTDEDGNTTTNSTWGGRNPGCYAMLATDANGCELLDTICVDTLNPIADFDVISNELNTDLQGTAPVDVTFINQSLYFSDPDDPLTDTTHFWNLDTANASWQFTDDYFEQFDTTYGPLGTSYLVNACLTVINQNGCEDTHCELIEIFEPITFTPINVFSPNGDGLNDEFTFEFVSKSISDFECVIVNRWGVKVGEILDINNGWNGTDLNGDEVADGTYFYVYKATTDNSTILEGQGTVNVVRGKK